MNKQSAMLIILALGLFGCALKPESQNSIHSMSEQTINHVSGFLKCMGGGIQKHEAQTSAPHTAIW